MYYNAPAFSSLLSGNLVKPAQGHKNVWKTLLTRAKSPRKHRGKLRISKTRPLATIGLQNLKMTVSGNTENSM
jgi:hypothetical protein